MFKVNDLETILKCIETYLSRGNFEDQLDAWIENPLVAVDPAIPPGEGSVSAMILRAK